MCRHLAYVGPSVTLDEVIVRPPHGLYEQSWAPERQQHGTVNADGFGIGWYPQDDPGEPARYRRNVPIWADANLPELARVVSSSAVLAAVRDATEGTSQDESAAAPFRDGPWLFSHNGAVEEWTRLPAAIGDPLDSAELLSLEARSDSALLWSMLAQRLRQGEPAAGALSAVVRQVAEARPTARLNVLLTDGRSITATRRGDTLWYRTAPGEVRVASEPDGTGKNGDWHEVPADSVLLAGPGWARTAPLRPAIAVRRQERFTLEHRLPEDYLTTTLRADVLAGLAEPPRRLPPKWFYDARGGELFEEITRLPEYYPTRAEQEILTTRASEIAALTRARSMIELGSGSSRKTRLLLDALTAAGTLVRYAPMDVSDAALIDAGEALCRDYPDLLVTGTVADFEADPALPDEAEGPRIVAFFGSTIGNLDPAQRHTFYRALRRGMSGDDVFLLGADLVKDPETLIRAYDDGQGVTAAFNRNVLHVLNRELDADFDPDAFDHVALWNVEQERIEMHLRSRRAQSVKIRGLDLTVDFAEGEHLHTENSAKFRRAGLTAELAAGGFEVRHWWTDEAERFALLLAVPDR